MKKSKFVQFFIHLFQGMCIGTGAILPGISGGVLCVAFGIYEPIMEFLTHPFKTIKKQYGLFIPIILGGGIGFVLLAGIIEKFLAASETAALMLFVGLIAGTIPGLTKDALKHKPTKGWGFFAVVLFGAYILFNILDSSSVSAITPNFWWWIFCGAIWGLSMIVPGLSSSSVLLFIGLYEPMAAGIADLDFKVLIPLMAGFGVTVLSLSRVVKFFLDKHPVAFTRVILGFVLASTILITPVAYASVTQLLIGLGCFAGGFAVSYIMDSKKAD